MWPRRRFAVELRPLLRFSLLSLGSRCTPSHLSLLLCYAAPCVFINWECSQGKGAQWDRLGKESGVCASKEVKGNTRKSAMSSLLVAKMRVFIFHGVLKSKRRGFRSSNDTGHGEIKWKHGLKIGWRFTFFFEETSEGKWEEGTRGKRWKEHWIALTTGRDFEFVTVAAFLHLWADWLLH